MDLAWSSGGILPIAPDLSVKVSARHARIRVDGSGILYRDEWSTNGSRVNGSEVEGDVLLSDHDVVSIGETDLEVLIMGRLPSKEEERADDWGHATA